MSNGKESTQLLKDAASVTAGAGASIFLQRAVYMAVLPTKINPEAYSFAGTDILLMAAELAGAYFTRKKPLARNFFIGMASANVVTNLFEATNGGKIFNNLGSSASANSANATYAGVHSPRSSPIAPPANPQQQLVAGSYGGHGPATVYKPNTSGQNTAIVQQLFV